MAEREELTRAIETALASALAGVAQNPIAVVTAVDETTISCRPVVQRVVNGEAKDLPEFIEVPPVFMYGGQSHETYPLAVGDYCLLMISERCYDRWYEGDDFKPPAEYRLHDYSDAFALVGILPRAKALTIPDRITQIGDKYKEGDHEHVGNLVHEGDTDHTGNVTHEGDTTQTGNYTLDGDMSASGNTESGTYSAGGEQGISTTFATGDGRTATFTEGLLTKVQ